MFPVQIRLFGTSLETIFPNAIPYSKANLEQVGSELLNSFNMQGLTPEQLVLTKRNELFDYELSFQLFHGSATFSVNAQRIKLTFSNASSSQDVTTITDAAVRYYHCFQLPVDARHRVDANAQFTFESPEDFASFFSTKNTKWHNEFPQAGIIAYLAEPDWPEQIRVVIDLSLLIEGGGFIMPSTSFRGLVTAEVLSRVQEVFDSAAKQCQLDFKPIP